MHDILYDIGCASRIDLEKINGSTREKKFATFDPENPNEEANKFYKLLKKAEQQLYPKCENFSKLSFFMELLNIKCLYGSSNIAFDALLALLIKAFPMNNKVPKSYYEARKIIQDRGLDYVKIDVCMNDCILFWKKYAEIH